MIYNDPMFWPRKKPQKVTLTFSGGGGGYPDCYVQIGDKIYATLDDMGDVIVDAGTEVLCYIDSSVTVASIALNGVEQSVPYTYIAQENATIEINLMSFGPELNCSINIIEASYTPEMVTLTLTGFDINDYIYVEIGGVQYGSGQVVDVEVGSTANCYIDNTLAMNLKVIVNDVTVKSESGNGGVYFIEYPYTVTKNATINFAANPVNASISITEEA